MLVVSLDFAYVGSSIREQMSPLNSRHCSCIAGQKLPGSCHLDWVVTTPTSILCSAMSDNLGELCRCKLVKALNGIYFWEGELIVLGLFGGLGRVFEKLGSNLRSHMSAADRRW